MLRLGQWIIAMTITITAYDNGDEHVMMNKRMRLRGILIFGTPTPPPKKFLKGIHIARSVPRVLKRQQDRSGVENRLAMACRGWASRRPMCKFMCKCAINHHTSKRPTPDKTPLPSTLRHGHGTTQTSLIASQGPWSSPPVSSSIKK